MQIDRSKFLLLTASIAGGSCSSNSPSSGGPVVVAAPIVALPDSEVAAAPTSSASATKPASGGGNSSDEETLAAADRAPVASAEDGSMCDEGGTPPTGCSTLRAPGPQCESFSDTKMICGKFARGLRPHVAEKAVDCLVAKSGKQAICDFSIAAQCGMAAVQKGCVEPSTQSACQPIVRKCGNSLQMRDCQALLSSVVSKNRRAMISCMTEGCALEYCMWDIE